MEPRRKYALTLPRWRRTASTPCERTRRRLGGGRSFIFNNVFCLRYVEIESELRRGLNVLKMRQSEHEKGLHEFTIDANGLAFGERIEGLSGMLGWSALRGNEDL